MTTTSDTNLTNIDLTQFQVIGGGVDGLTASAAARVRAFVKAGGGYIVDDFGASPGYQDDVLGLSAGSTPATTSSALSIVVAGNDITKPYSSIAFSPYYLNYQISELGNESAQVIVKDSHNNPVITANDYYSGIGVSIELPDQSRLQYMNWGDSWINLYVNAVLYAAHEGGLAPVFWQTSYTDMPSTFVYQSVDGSPGGPVLLWLSNNATTRSTFGVNLNASFYGISTSGWQAVSAQNMSVIASGTGSDISIRTTVGAKQWEPIYVMSKPSISLAEMYSTAAVSSSSLTSGGATYTMTGGLNSSSWLILHAPNSILSVSSSLTGTISSSANLASLNATKIGYTCSTVVSSVCAHWVSNMQQGWFYDAANQLLYIHYQGSYLPMTLTITQAGGSTTSSSSSSTTSTSSTSTTSSGGGGGGGGGGGNYQTTSSTVIIVTTSTSSTPTSTQSTSMSRLVVLLIAVVSRSSSIVGAVAYRRTGQKKHGYRR